jgi:acyl-homoserine-lactone acylase
MKKKLIYLKPGLASVLVFIFLFNSFAYSQKNEKTELLWDNYGVPHIYGRNTPEMYYAFGWAQMKNHADLILKLYAQARGQAAGYWGKEFLDTDKLSHLFELTTKAENAYKQLSPEVKDNLDAFVKGVNDYANLHPNDIGEKYRQVLPVAATDVISHTLRITCLEFIGAEDLQTAKKMADAGSNAMAIAPSKSASKNSMLIINPHLPWSDYFLWFESHLNSPEYSVYGVSLVGMPSVTMGFNNNLGWAHTINPIDVSDRYELELNGDSYALDGKNHPFDKRKVKIKVKQSDGSVAEQIFEFKYSVHGPVLAETLKKAYAIRIAGLDNVGIYEEYFKMAKARNFNEFESALKMMQIPMFNIIYADKAGNIFYLFNGNIPVRDEGDFAFWKGTIDGTQSKFIWNKYHSYSELPKLLNPPTGFIQNCNDAPWSCTYPFVLRQQDYPSYFSSQTFLLRPQRAVNLVKDNKSVTFEQLIGYKLNTGMESADRFLDDLLKAVNNHPDPLAVEAAKVLSKWDRKTDSDSKGAVLFAAWWDKVNSSQFKTQWNLNEPVTTPRGLANEKEAVELLVKAANETHKKYGALDIAWGDVHRFMLNGNDYPANGGPGDHYGIFRTMYFTDVAQNKKAAIAGETFIAVVEFGETVKAMVCLSYGNATQPGNKHFGDQFKMMSDRQLRPALLDKENIIKNLEGKETFSDLKLQNDE